MGSKDGKKPSKPTKSTKKADKYKVSGDKLEHIGRTCPKCGPAVFMGEHKDRFSCGKCGYTEKKSSDKPKRKFADKSIDKPL